MADYLSKFSGEEIDSLLDKIKDFNVINEIPSKSITDDKIADSSITTSLLSNGSVTMPKLGNDVTELITEIKNKGITNAIDIKTNQNFSLFNSDRLNLLEAQINADKNTIEYTSDKPLEITCNGANIIDCNAHFKKVEGQTRRYSLNLWEYSGRNDAHGVDLKVEGQDITVTNNNTEEITWCSLSNKHSLKAGTYTMGCYMKGKGTIYAVNSVGNKEITARIHGENDLVITLLTIDKEEPSIQFRTDLYGNSSQTTFINLFIYEGNLSKEDLPLFKPYDNTLVNSKANFVSTGRNLFKYNGQYETGNCGLKYDGSNFVVTSGTSGSAGDYWCQVHNGIKLPKGTYHFGCNAINGTGTIYIVDSKGRKELSFRYTATGQIKGTFTSNEDEESISFRISPSTINASTTFTDLFITKADTGYEPYIKNISQYDIELGAFDYIENGNLVKQTSEMITLNGSENWSNVSAQSKPNDKLFSITITDVGAIDRSGASNTTLPLADVWLPGTGEGYYCYNKNIFIRKNVANIEEFKQWLKANPITLVYQKATPTITPIVVPNGIVSYKNGLTIQEIRGKYLPYKYTAKYVNGEQQ